MDENMYRSALGWMMQNRLVILFLFWRRGGLHGNGKRQFLGGGRLDLIFTFELDLFLMVFRDEFGAGRHTAALNTERALQRIHRGAYLRGTKYQREEGRGTIFASFGKGGIVR